MTTPLPAADNSNLYACLFRRFAHALDQPFLRVPDGATLTYGDVDHRSAQIAGALSGLGVQRGDRVVVQVHKSTDAIALYLACLRMGVVFVTLNTAYTDNEVAFFVEDAAPTLVVRSPDRGAIGSIPLATLGPADSPVGAANAGSLGDAADRAEPFHDIVTSEETDTATMLYTSGTTGRSKGAMINHRGLASNGASLHEMWHFADGDVLLHALPVFHVHGLFVALHPAMMNASEVIFLPRFTTEAVVAHLPESTVFMGVPTFYTRLMADPAFTPEACRTLRLFTSGSAPMTEIVHQEFEARSGHRIVERYGMTETGIITSNPIDGDRVAGTVGFATPGFDVRVAADDGTVLGPDEAGVVEIKGPGLFNGYWQLPEKTASEFRPDGFFITGDVGQMDAEGRLTLEGRSSDMIISGGLNVYPKEVEMALDELPGIVESAVVGLPHPDFGEVVAAFVVLEDGVQFGKAEAEAALGDELARFKLPKAVLQIDALPRNTMAKVQKKQLRVDHADLFTS